MRRAASAITGAAPVPVPPPMPAAMKHMFAPSSARSISLTVSSAAALPTSGRAPAPNPPVMSGPSWIRCSAMEFDRACASVLATMNSTPSILASIMLAIALPPAPPTPTTTILGRMSSPGAGPMLMLMYFPSLEPCSPADRTPGLFKARTGHTLASIPNGNCPRMKRAILDNCDQKYSLAARSSRVTIMPGL